MDNFYEILEISEDATRDDVRKAYRSLAKRVHPDSGTGDEEKFHKVNTAYKVLSDPDSRRDYDVTLQQYKTGRSDFASYNSDVVEVSGKQIQKVLREMMRQTNLTRVRVKYQGKVILDVPFAAATALTIAGLAMAPLATILLNVGVNNFFEMEVKNVVMDLYEEAAAAHEKGDLASAESAYLGVLEKSRFFVPARLNLGMLYRQLGENKKATECFREVLKMTPFGEIGDTARKNLEEIRGF